MVLVATQFLVRVLLHRLLARVDGVVALWRENESGLTSFRFFFSLLFVYLFFFSFFSLHLFFPHVGQARVSIRISGSAAVSARLEAYDPLPLQFPLSPTPYSLPLGVSPPLLQLVPGYHICTVVCILPSNRCTPRRPMRIDGTLVGLIWQV